MKPRLLVLFIFLPIQLITSYCIGQSVKFDWVRTANGTNLEFGTALILDSSGNVYNTGYFHDTVDFDPGPLELNLISAGYSDLFVQKLDNNGNLLWVKSIGGITSDVGNSIAVDSLNNIFIVGTFSDSVDFDPNLGEFNLNAGGFNHGFILKLDPDGNFIDVKAIQSNSGVNIVAIDISTNGYLYLTGSYSGMCDFDPAVSVFNLNSAGSNDIFVAKYDLDLNFIWANSYGGISADVGNGIEVDIDDNVLVAGVQGQGFIRKIDSNGLLLWSGFFTGNLTCSGVDTDTLGNVLVCGYYNYTVDVDPGAATFNLTTFGTQNACIISLMSDGNFMWAKSIGGGGDDKYHAITIDEQGDILLTGQYQATVDFDPGLGINTITSVSNSSDIFVHKLDSNGEFIWAKSMGGNFTDSGKDIISDNNGNVYLTGVYQGAADFNPGVANYIVNATNSDLFVEKLGNCIPSYSTQTITACDSYQWINGKTYLSSNSIDTYNVLNGASDGCDSIIYLNLTINNSETSIDTITSCISYTWTNGISYTSSGTYTQTLTNTLGCDSVATLILTIKTVNLGVNQLNDSTFYANASGATFQWLDCNNDYSQLLGQNNQEFVSTMNGSYAVEVSQNGCIDTSMCYSVAVGIEENMFFDSLIVAPNPTSGEITLSLGALYPNVEIQIYDIVGNILDVKSFILSDQIKLSLNGPSGFYIVRLIASGKQRSFKVFKLGSDY